VKTIVLFEKDMERSYAITPDYVGKKIPNVWVSGFGMDYNHKYRNLRDLVALDDEDKQQ
jgi:hypoxanthine-guanine phosphoribosyltransferase